MDVEGIAEVERRAARHAALSDPARLRVIDLLSLGDLSPSELQHALGMPSNLVAHHLKVLEAEGIIARSRSEADRRRSYARLVPAALEGLLPRSVLRAHRVVFVCTANSARSQLAAALWRRHSEVPVASAGTHPATRIDPGAVSVARRHDMSMPLVAPRLLSEVLTADDFVVTVCDRAHEELDRVDLHWSVPDPVRAATAEAFDAAYDTLAHRVGELAARFTAA